MVEGDGVAGGGVEPGLGVGGLEEVVGGGELGGGPTGEVVGFVEVFGGDDEDSEGCGDVVLPELGMIAPNQVPLMMPPEGIVADEADAELVEGEAGQRGQQGIEALTPVIITTCDTHLDRTWPEERERADFFTVAVITPRESCRRALDAVGEDGVGGGGVGPEVSVAGALEEVGVVFGEPVEAGGDEVVGQPGVGGGPFTKVAGGEGAGVEAEGQTGFW